MFSSLCVLLSTFLLSLLGLSCGSDASTSVTSPFKASFGSSPAPFQIDVDPAFIASTKLKASLTRYAVDLDQPDFADGPPRHNVTTVRDYWVNKYDWFEVQRDLNTQ